MTIQLGFYGAAKNVTGSAYLLEANGKKLLIDCGLYQERKLKDRNWDGFPVEPATIDAVLLTHAHLDHCGRLPKLVSEGFNGPVWTTPATAEIARIVMLDSGKIQEEDAAFKKKRHQREGRKVKHPEVPLYTVEDAEKVLPLFKHATYNEWIQITDGIEACFREAGHILGSASIGIRIQTDNGSRTIVFSGDLGRYHTPIIKDPDPFDAADYVVTESTYGDREHEDNSHIPGELAQIFNETKEASGNIVIPSFAVERAQELLYHLGNLLQDDRIPHIMIVLDSPMAVRVTDVFRKHPELFDKETQEMLAEGNHPCDFPGLSMSQSVAQSKAINHINGTVAIIAGSGMCTGGRVKHHLKHNISRPESTILFVGYQAVGTLGRIILDGAEEVRIHGETYPVRAKIKRIHGFSAHGDYHEMMKWMDGLQQPPKKIFVTHGEEESAMSYAKRLKEHLQCEVDVPEYQDVVELI